MEVNGTTYPNGYPLEVVSLLERERTKPDAYKRRIVVEYPDDTRQIGYVERSCGAGPRPVRAVGLRYRRGAMGIDLLFSGPVKRILTTRGDVLWFDNG